MWNEDVNITRKNSTVRTSLTGTTQKSDARSSPFYGRSPFPLSIMAVNHLSKQETPSTRAMGRGYERRGGSLLSPTSLAAANWRNPWASQRDTRWLTEPPALLGRRFMQRRLASRRHRAVLGAYLSVVTRSGSTPRRGNRTCLALPAFSSGAYSFLLGRSTGTLRPRGLPPGGKWTRLRLTPMGACELLLRRRWPCGSVIIAKVGGPR